MIPSQMHVRVANELARRGGIFDVGGRRAFPIESISSSFLRADDSIGRPDDGFQIVEVETQDWTVTGDSLIAAEAVELRFRGLFRFRGPGPAGLAADFVEELSHVFRVDRATLAHVQVNGLVDEVASSMGAAIERKVMDLVQGCADLSEVEVIQLDTEPPAPGRGAQPAGWGEWS